MKCNGRFEQDKCSGCNSRVASAPYGFRYTCPMGVNLRVVEGGVDLAARNVDVNDIGKEEMFVRPIN